MNTPASPPKASRTRAKSFRTLHRYLGLALLLPVLLLAITGVFLELTDELKLGSSGVPFSFVHRQYAISAPEEITHSGPITQVGDRLFTESRQVQAESPLKGGYELELIDLVFLEDELIIIPNDALAPTERNTIPRYRAVGVTDNLSFVLDTADGYLFSHDLGASWGRGRLMSVRWLEAKVESITPTLRQRYGEAHISWERWLQDLHSGRFFGQIGIWIMSFAGFTLLILAMTGFIVWLSGTRK